MSAHISTCGAFYDAARPCVCGAASTRSEADAGDARALTLRSLARLMSEEAITLDELWRRVPSPKPRHARLKRGVQRLIHLGLVKSDFLSGTYRYRLVPDAMDRAALLDEEIAASAGPRTSAPDVAPSHADKDVRGPGERKHPGILDTPQRMTEEERARGVRLDHVRAREKTIVGRRNGYFNAAMDCAESFCKPIEGADDRHLRAALQIEADAMREAADMIEQRIRSTKAKAVAA